MWTDLTSVAGALLFPRICGACGVSLGRDESHLCWTCRPALHLITAPYCACCGEPVHGSIDHDYVCHACTRRAPLYRRARAAIHYNAVGRGMITQFKYNHALWMQPFLVELLVSAVEAHYPGESFDALCAVPLHAVKRRERGFNQSSLLAVALARRLRIPLQGRRTLRRVRLTPSQTRLTARQRMTNVLGAFEAAKPAEWAGKRILLLDDVMTTGATVGACAKALTDAGAASVDVITVARGI